MKSIDSIKGFNDPSVIANFDQVLSGLFSEAFDQLTLLSILTEAMTQPIESEEDAEKRMQIIDKIYSHATTMDHIAISFAEAISDKIYEYENKNIQIPDVSSRELLKFFINRDGLTQSDLKSIASQSIISEIINGKRKMTLGQIKKAAEFFEVKPEFFLDDCG